METKKKKFDAVAFMRKARRKLEKEWADKSRSEQLDYFKKKYAKRSEDSRV